MNDATHFGCGCCAGTTALTPLAIANRPGLHTLTYRVGTHAAFLETMLARLADLSLDADRAERDGSTLMIEERRPLRGLTTRRGDDASIALLDAWATIADVLTFYQERIANEGYLRTATERRSILELARLVGYALRPGVAATVFLAYTIDPLVQGPVVIAVGAKVQSVPGPDELPQTFETVESLEARSAWNTIVPRRTRPQTAASILAGGPRIYLKGIVSSLQPNDPLLLELGDEPVLYRVMRVEPDADHDRTLVRLQLWGLVKSLAVTLPPVVIGFDASTSDTALAAMLPGLIKRASIPPASSNQLTRAITTSFAARGDAGLRVLSTLHPELRHNLSAAVANVQVTQASGIRAHALRVKAGPYGSTAPKRAIFQGGTLIGFEEWPLASDSLAIRVFSVPTGVESSEDHAAISIQRGGHTDSGEITIPTHSVTEKIGDTEVTIERTAGVQKVTYTFVFSDGAKRVVEVILASGISVTIDGRTWNVASGQAFRSSINGHVVAIERPAGTSANDTTRYSVTDETTTAVAEADRSRLALDGQHNQVVPESWAAVVRLGHKIVVARVLDVQTVARTDFNLSARVTELLLDPAQPWLTATDRSLADIRDATVFAQSEQFELAEEPITEDIQDGATVAIELDGLYTDLQSGRWLIIAGERSDISDGHGNVVRGLMGGELVMLAEVRHDYDPTLAGDRVLTRIRLAKPLAYRYRRDGVTIYGNVVKATHGETRHETLGSSDGSMPLQSFALRQPPLTYVSAPTPSGIQSTLHVYVNDVEWQVVDALDSLGPTDRHLTTRTDDERTTIIFGNGEHGARPPGGVENIRAVYRNGIGSVGNVEARQISLLQSRPLGVKDVINPLRASGGADREDRDEARHNAPLAVLALDRLVSTQDYADFARTFAGVGKADARRLTDGRREIVHLTIAGANDIPIERTGDLYRNLLTALRTYGDPDRPIRIDTRMLKLLVISARIRLEPDALWNPVVGNVRAALLARFSFGQRDLGQDVTLGEVIGTIQHTPGVAYVDVDLLRGIPEQIVDAGASRPTTPSEIIAAAGAPQTTEEPLPRIVADLARSEARVILPAELILLTPNVPDLLVLNRIQS